MKASELYTILQGTGFPVAYDHFEEEQEAPFLVFVTDRTDNAFADNSVYKVRNHWSIYLCTKIKDESAEETTEAVLNDSGLVWDKVETYVDSEKLYEITYEIMTEDK